MTSTHVPNVIGNTFLSFPYEKNWINILTPVSPAIRAVLLSALNVRPQGLCELDKKPTGSNTGLCQDKYAAY